MFEKKQIIYSETQGVCRVDNIVSLSATKGVPGVPYYVLRSVFDADKVSYRPSSGCTSGAFYQRRSAGADWNRGT